MHIYLYIIYIYTLYIHYKYLFVHPCMKIMKLASHLQRFLAISARKKHASFFISKFHSPRDRAVAPKNGVATARSESAVGLWHFQVLVNDTDTLYTLLHINCTYRNHTTNVYAYTHMYTYMYIYICIMSTSHTHTYIYIQICNPLTLLIPKFLVNFQTEIFSLGLGLGSDLAGRWCGNAWNRPGAGGVVACKTRSGRHWKILLMQGGAPQVINGL